MQILISRNGHRGWKQGPGSLDVWQVSECQVAPLLCNDPTHSPVEVLFGFEILPESLQLCCKDWQHLTCAASKQVPLGAPLPSHPRSVRAQETADASRGPLGIPGAASTSSICFRTC